MLELLAARLQCGELHADQLQLLSQRLASRPLLPAASVHVSQRQQQPGGRQAHGGSGGGGGGGGSRSWGLGHARLGPDLLLEDGPGSATAITLSCTAGDGATSSSPVTTGTVIVIGGPPSAVGKEALSGGPSFLALGAPASATTTASMGKEEGAALLAASLAPPPGLALQRLLQALGVQLLSQRVERRVQELAVSPGMVSAPMIAEGQHAAICRRARAVFPLVQRYLLQVPRGGKDGESIS